MRIPSVAIGVSVVVALALSASADPSRHSRQKHPTPKTFDQYAVFMANGTIPFEPHPNSAITGCGDFIFCDGDFFQETIMGRSAAEIEEEADRAKQYFRDRFGVDVDHSHNAGRLRFFSFYLDPRGDYRVYSMAGERVPARGWKIRDGGFGAMVLDPEGFELGGEFDGTGLVMQPGAMLVYGNYNIKTTGRSRRSKGGEIVYSYRSDMPMVENAWGELVVNCQISTDDFADGVHNGKAQGMGMPLVPGPDGFTLSWRNVLTIPKD